MPYLMVPVDPWNTLFNRWEWFATVPWWSRPFVLPWLLKGSGAAARQPRFICAKSPDQKHHGVSKLHHLIAICNPTRSRIRQTTAPQPAML